PRAERAALARPARRSRVPDSRYAEDPRPLHGAVQGGRDVRNLARELRARPRRARLYAEETRAPDRAHRAGGTLERAAARAGGLVDRAPELEPRPRLESARQPRGARADLGISLEHQRRARPEHQSRPAHRP